MIAGISTALPRISGDSDHEARLRSNQRTPGNGTRDTDSAASVLRNSRPTSADGVGSPANAPQDVEKAAEEFEALLVAQMLRMFREAGSGGWLGSTDGEGANPAMDLAEAQLGKALAQAGALGIKEQLVRNLARTPERAVAPQAAGSVEGNQARRGLNSAAEGT